MRIRTTCSFLFAGLLAVTGMAVPGPASALAGSPSSRPEARQCSPSVSIGGFSDELDKTSFDGAYVGNLSALAPNGEGGLLALSDRSALFTLDRTGSRPTRVVPLADEQGRELDAEGLVVDRDGGLLVSSEVEPSVRRFTADGALLGRLPVPPELMVAPAGRAVRNGTFEGLTLSPQGHRLLAAMEYPITGDGPGIVRLQTWERRGRAEFELAAQFGYRADPGLGVP